MLTLNKAMFMYAQTGRHTADLLITSTYMMIYLFVFINIHHCIIFHVLSSPLLSANSLHLIPSRLWRPPLSLVSLYHVLCLYSQLSSSTFRVEHTRSSILATSHAYVPAYNMQHIQQQYRHKCVQHAARAFTILPYT